MIGRQEESTSDARGTFFFDLSVFIAIVGVFIMARYFSDELDADALHAYRQEWLEGDWKCGDSMRISFHQTNIAYRGAFEYCPGLVFDYEKEGAPNPEDVVCLEGGYDIEPRGKGRKRDDFRIRILWRVDDSLKPYVVNTSALDGAFDDRPWFECWPTDQSINGGSYRKVSEN